MSKAGNDPGLAKGDLCRSGAGPGPLVGAPSGLQVQPVNSG